MTADQLRKSILQQAIQGKLVPQDPNDEPASALLERIREEKARLVKEKKIKKEKNPSVIFRGEDNSHYEKFILTGEVKCIDDEIPFELPKGWEWCRLGDVALVTGGYAFSSESLKSPQGIRVVRISDFNEQGWVNKSIARYDGEDIASQYEIHINDLLLAMTGGTVGKSFFVQEVPEKMYLNQRVAIIRSTSLLPEYINIHLKSLFIIDLINSIKNSTNDNISMRDITSFPFPLPPLAEQQRIVAKIEELMPLVEQYGKAQNKLEVLNTNIREQLKKSILEYAIEGKLVAQCEEDGTAEDLLQEIQAEKQRLYAEGKLKKKDLTHSTIFRGEDNKYYEQIGKEVICIDEEIPFEIPVSWRWVRLADISIFLSRGKSPKYSDVKQIPVFAQKCNLKSGDISLDEVKFLDTSTLPKWKDEYKLRHQDILINSTGTGTVGRIGIFSESLLRNYPFIVPDSHISVVRLSSASNPMYIFNVLSSNAVQSYIEDNLAGSTNQKELYIGTLGKLLIPLPPILEQQRIATSITQIIRLIEG